MGAPLDDAAAVHHHDQVGVEHGRQPVRDDQRGAPARRAGRARRGSAPRSRRRAPRSARRAAGSARRAGWRGRSTAAGARRRRTGRRSATTGGVVALRQRADEAVGGGGAGGGLDLGRGRRRGGRSRCSRATVPESSTESWLTTAIWSRSEASVSERMSWPSSRIRPAGRVVEPRQQVEDRGLARPGAADEGDALPRLDRSRSTPSSATWPSG